MAKDSLDNEVSIAGQLTERGVKAKARSRFVSAADRLLGNLVDFPNPTLERIAARKRATTDGEIRDVSSSKSRWAPI